ncbi:IclR family transcriptional regulator [Corynebacterium hylobatis]|uniref:IclR family transcriptional regulator n=2 Tax=Corynebacterium hylobatis TaxID=1859290 RepID=A0A3S0BGI4_9CORY|nr:IclR family transcriptional regulator [Corynebacterium hylobatis]
MANSRSGESVIVRVVRILEVLSGHTASMSVREIAAKASLPVTTAHRLLGELESEDLVARDAAGRWQHGNRLWEIASRGTPTQELRQAALPPMEDLMLELNVHISLGILDRNEVLYLERLGPDEKTVNITQIAGRLPAHATSAGLILTAFGNEEDQELMMRRQLPRFTDDTITDAAALKRLFRQIRRDGFVVASGTIVPESTGLSVPVFGQDEHATAALTVIVPRGDENLAVMIPQLKFAARAIQRRLGGSPDRPQGIRRESNQGPLG